MSSNQKSLYFNLIMCSSFMKQALFLLITSGLNVLLKRVNCESEGSQLQYALFQMKVAGRKSGG